MVRHSRDQRPLIDSEDCRLCDKTGLVLSGAGIVAVMISGEAGDDQHTSSGACRPELDHLETPRSNVTYRSGHYARARVSSGSVE